MRGIQPKWTTERAARLREAADAFVASAWGLNSKGGWAHDVAPLRAHGAVEGRRVGVITDDGAGSEWTTERANRLRLAADAATAQMMAWDGRTTRDLPNMGYGTMDGSNRAPVVANRTGVEIDRLDA